MFRTSYAIHQISAETRRLFTMFSRSLLSTRHPKPQTTAFHHMFSAIHANARENQISPETTAFRSRARIKHPDLTASATTQHSCPNASGNQISLVISSNELQIPCRFHPVNSDFSDRSQTSPTRFHNENSDFTTKIQIFNPRISSSFYAHTSQISQRRIQISRRKLRILVKEAAPVTFNFLRLKSCASFNPALCEIQQTSGIIFHKELGISALRTTQICVPDFEFHNFDFCFVQTLFCTDFTVVIWVTEYSALWVP
ncbi:hypothetical protein F511_11173 [Dorcoceras hygrometricum]|uniref:Uncharacterized protein n=1 Tax=Dorcoceras hygrometricum TaxID=472368 RepID=A0A2Z7CAB4_9LAMI|nr:hypothetical protein F511_11173 [Dorcoceras hygrometricum]